MAWRFWIKFEGSTEPTFQPVNTLGVELPILGILPSFEIESDTITTIGGTQVGQRRMRYKLDIDFFPVSTWDTDTTNTDNVLYLLKDILQMKYTRIVAPTAPKILPDRWRNSTAFPKTAALIPFVFAKCEIGNEKMWASGNERLTMSVYAKELN